MAFRIRIAKHGAYLQIKLERHTYRVEIELVVKQKVYSSITESSNVYASRILFYKR